MRKYEAFEDLKQQCTWSTESKEGKTLLGI